MGVGLLLSAVLLAGGAAGRTATRPVSAPPRFLNIVHHRLKRGAPAAYAGVEASIVTAFDRAKVPLYWMTFQSRKDPRDVLYLNAFDAAADLNRAGDAYRAIAPQHPELAKLSARLSSMIENQTSVLTARRDEVAYARTDVDFTTQRALLLVTFHVKAGHEGKFMEAARKAGAGGSPWILYEAADEPTFVLVSPMRSRAETRRPAPIPRPIRELRGIYHRATTEVYALAPAMSRLPVLRPAMQGSRTH
jgi:hypothetical protein